MQIREMPHVLTDIVAWTYNRGQKLDDVDKLDFRKDIRNQL